VSVAAAHASEGGAPSRGWLDRTPGHRAAVALMLLCTLLWSMAGIVTRQVEAAEGFEVTFWRSAANAVVLAVALAWLRGPAALVRNVREGGRVLWLSAACWCTMYTAFMLALTLTTVANVLVTMAVAPLLTALVARVALGQRLAPRTWAAITLAGAGIGWMYGSELAGAEARHGWGTLVALGVPVAAAVNWTLLQHIREQAARARAAGTATAAGMAVLGDATSKPAPKPPHEPDMLAAVLLGAVASALITLPLALPWQASASDIAWLSFLGAFQLALPCLLCVIAARALAAPEASLLSLLEVVFGVAWVWLASAEQPSAAVIGGGLVVLAALAGHEVLGWRRQSEASARAQPPV
jgi:drug/metabolite transporter (DMT)-like permease